MLTPQLIRRILTVYPLPPFGIHGISHWARVLENGLRVAEQSGADSQVVALFAVFHDSRRCNEGTDPGHGRRGADFAAELRGEFFELSDELFQLLYFACEHHTAGQTAGDITVQTCWDADRLDLGRVGLTPDRRFLCTAAAQERPLLDWAIDRSRRGFVPEIVHEVWTTEIQAER